MKNKIFNISEEHKLTKRVDVLSKKEVIKNLKTKKWAKEHYCFFKEIDSTNNYAKKLANDEKPEGTVIVAEEQSQGRGRLNRNWLSSKGKAILTSIILRPSISPEFAAQITLVMAVGIIRALKRKLNIEAKIKWPNDIIINDLKVCGILTEMSAEIERVDYIIVGIGLNVNNTVAEFPEEIKKNATSLRICLGQEVNRVELFQTILEELEEVYNSYLKEGFSRILEEWKDNSYTLGEKVVVKMPQKIIEGIAIDIDKYGCLIVKDKLGKKHEIIAGDVLVRKE